MNFLKQKLPSLFVATVCFTFILIQISCATETVNESDVTDEPGRLVLPDLEAVAPSETPLKVVATTSIIGDVVAQVGGDAITLTVLIAPGQDPHSYEPAARDLTAVATADVIFVNGWDLEETLIDDLAEIGRDIPFIPISAGITPLPLSEEAADPHVWLAIDNVKQWVSNTEIALSELDPDNTALFAANASDYLGELSALEQYVESQLAQIADSNRVLVSNHDSLGYFADQYGFTLLGTVIPSASTLAEPSTRDLTRLINLMAANDTCAIFTESTVSDALAQTVVAELDSCDEVAVVQLYTGALGPAGSGADSYISMYRANIDAIVAVLR